LINEGITCPHCNNYTDLVHQTRPNFSERFIDFWQVGLFKSTSPVSSIVVNVKNPQQNHLLGSIISQRQTNRYQEYIYERVKELTVEQVSQNESIGRDAVQSIFHKIAQLKKKTGECLNA
jgi:hypothetical protein